MYSVRFLCSAARQRTEALELQGCVVRLQEQPFALSVCTPLMQRALLSDTDARSLFIDTSASCDQLNTSLTLMLVATKAGAVPVGVSLHDSQNELSYATVFAQLKEMWATVCPAAAIANFMTDDSKAMKLALKTVWPDVRQLLCLFHVPQALWRWLCDSKNGVPKEDRQQVMQYFSAIIRAATPEAAQQFVQLLEWQDDESKVARHITSLWDRRQEWCIAYRSDIRNRGHNTNNYAEATFRIIKDIILTRLKAFNPLSLLDYIVGVLEKYYSGRLLSAAFGRLTKP